MKNDFYSGIPITATYSLDILLRRSGKDAGSSEFFVLAFQLRNRLLRLSISAFRSGVPAFQKRNRLLWAFCSSVPGFQKNNRLF